MKALKLILAVTVVALAPAIARAAPGDPGTGLQATDHDFYGGAFLQNTNVGLCTFCHTPHKALSTLLLWNHTLSSATFTWDVPKTTAGTEFPAIVGNTYKGPTAKCLSCHDGTVAIGDVAWFMEQAWPGGTGLETTTMPADHQVGSGGAMAGNHPVAMPYPYLNVANTYNTKTTGSGATLSEWQATPLDPVKIYNDDGSGNITRGAVAAKSGIECSSCHDPHNKDSVGEMFLRGTLTGNTTAYICLKCHIK